MRLKTFKGEKSQLFTYLRFCARDEKKQNSYNGNIGLTKLVKVLFTQYEQKLVYQNPVKKQNCLNDSGATKKLNCLYETG